MRPSGSTSEEKPAVRALGIDVSYFDASINWETVKKVGTTPPGPRRVARSGKGTAHHNTLAVHGVDFAFIRATDPNHANGHHSKVPHGVDPMFHTYWHEAREAGVIRGPYHLFRPNLAVAHQVELFVNTVGALEADDLPPVFDLEKTGGQANEVIIERSHEWLQAVEKYCGRKPIIYVYPSFWNEHMLGQHKVSHHPGHHHHARPRHAGQNERHRDSPEQDRPPPQDLFSQYPLWIASYRSHPQLPQHPWGDWTFWQYTDKGSVRGVHKAEADCNVFRGSLEQLKNFIKQSMTGGSIGKPASAPAQPTQTEKSETPDNQAPALGKKPAPQASPDAPQEPPSPSTGSSEGTHTYVVQSGDTLDGLARRFGVSAEALASANKIGDPNLIRVGQVLIIP